MEDREMDLQKLTFFTEGNTFTGSRSKTEGEKRMLRYLVRPDRENGRLEAFAWTQDVCFEKAEAPEKADFPLDADGLQSVQEWLWDRFQAL